MDYKKQILTDLLESYEASELFRTGNQTRRIFLSKKCFAKLNQCMESADEKQEILDNLEDLSAQGLLSYSWVKHEKGNLVERVWLNTDPASIDQSYQISGKTNGRKQQEVLLSQLRESLRKLPEGDIYGFLLLQLNWIEEKYRIPRYFTGDEKEDQRLIDSLVFIGNNEGEITERVLSSRLFGDSKIFERSVRSKTVKCLRAIEKDHDEEDLRDEELLQKYGIVRWPELIEFCGNLIFQLDTGAEIDCCSSIYGAYLNSDTSMHIKQIHFKEIKRVLFIENKANYIWYIREQKQPEELVVFHGGFYSPSKGQWFEKLHQGGKDVESWEHWSDIDLGGFRIFQRLKSCLIPELKPYRMDAKTLLEMESQCIRIKDKRYLDKLAKLLENPEYELFHDVIKIMMEKKIRLEQEQLL